MWITERQHAALRFIAASWRVAVHQIDCEHGIGAEPLQGPLAGVNLLQIFALQSVVAAVHY
jgi:hypothetical protein